MTEHDKTPFSLNWISRIKYENEIKDLNPVINLVSIGKYKTGRDRHLWIAKFPNGYVDKRFAMFCDSKFSKNVCYISRNQLTKRKPADAKASSFDRLTEIRYIIYLLYTPNQSWQNIVKHRSLRIGPSGRSWKHQ